MEDIRYKNLRYLSTIFEILYLSIFMMLLLSLLNHDTKPVLMLASAAALFFICNFSLLGEKNDMSIYAL
jgi:hypothetical protein